MINKRLSELETDPELQGGELLYLAQDGRAYQVTLTALAQFVGATLDYEPADEAILKATDIGTEPGTVAAGDHDHGGDAANLGSGTALANRVLMANGLGGASWESIPVITVAATAPENPALNAFWLDIS